MSDVFLKTAEGYSEDLVDIFESALSLSEDLASRSSLLIKLNMCDFRSPETGAVVHPLFLAAVLKWIRNHDQAKKVYVLESDSTVVDADKFVRWLGYDKIISACGAEWINLSKCDQGEWVQGPLPGIRIVRPSIFDNGYLISLAKMKTNFATRITCSLKNQFGCIPWYRKSDYHVVLDRVIADANYVFKPNLVLVDGIIAQEGCQGPSYGRVTRLNLIVLSKDPVAANSVCARLMGFRPTLIKHIRYDEKLGVGTTKYNLMGDVDRMRNSCFKAEKVRQCIIRIGFALRNAHLKEGCGDIEKWSHGERG